MLFFSGLSNKQMSLQRVSGSDMNSSIKFEGITWTCEKCPHEDHLYIACVYSQLMPKSASLNIDSEAALALEMYKYTFAQESKTCMGNIHFFYKFPLQRLGKVTSSAPHHNFQRE